MAGPGKLTRATTWQEQQVRRLRGKQPKLHHRQEPHLIALLHGDQYSTAEFADLFGVARSSAYRAVQRKRVQAMVGIGSTVG